MTFWINRTEFAGDDYTEEWGRDTTQRSGRRIENGSRVEAWMREGFPFDKRRTDDLGTVWGVVAVVTDRPRNPHRIEAIEGEITMMGQDFRNRLREGMFSVLLGNPYTRSADYELMVLEVGLRVTLEAARQARR
jgi:hypothetical protein